MTARIVRRAGRGLTLLLTLSAALGVAVLITASAALGSTSLHDAHIGADSTTFNQECGPGEDPGGGAVLWHFVLTQTTAVNSGQLTATFQNAGPITVSYSKQSGGVLHWNIVTPGDDILLGAVTTADGDQLNLSHVCGGGGGGGGATADVTTEVHLGATDSGTPTVVDNANPAALGSTVHDSAAITTAPDEAELPVGSKVVFYFFNNNTCADDAIATADYPVSGLDRSVDPALVQGPLGAGEYSYRADFESGDADVVGNAVGACEPFKVAKGDLTIRTDIHNAAHAIVTSIAAGSVVHDTAALSGSVTGFDPNLSNVSFTFYTTSTTCTGDSGAVATAAPEGSLARSVDSAPLAVGHYSYSASFTGDSNYNPAGPADCEPLTVFQLGLTMGFWGNKNGVARIVAAGGYAVNAVNIGRGANIDTQAESLKVLPLTLNACGKGSVIIFTGQTSSAACSLATGVNVGSLNTLAAQTLALGYNIKLVSGYTGQSIGDLACVAVGTLTSASTVNDAFAAAVALINGSASGGTTTQSQIGLMNTLLGCLNREA